MKSHFYAERVIVRCYKAKARVVCIREVQNSIKDSGPPTADQQDQQHGAGLGVRGARAGDQGLGPARRPRAR
jgi:hypothetical protein